MIKIRVLYNKTDITTDITNSLVSLAYTDNISNEADEIQLNLEDVRGLWAGEWYPVKGDNLEVYLGDIPCGIFSIDELSISGPPDSVAVKGLAAGIKTTLRTKQTFGYENKTLRQICTKVAARNKLNVFGEISDITIERATQFRETDIEFLSRIATQYGYAFSIRGENITFTDVYALETSTPVVVLNKTDVISYSFTDRTAGTYKGANVRYRNPKNGRFVAFGIDATEFIDKIYSQAEKLDILNMKGKAENEAQAEAQALSALQAANKQGRTGTLTVPGNPLYLAGNVLRLKGFGINSGAWQIQRSRHNVDSNSGYIVGLELKKIND